jgi:hypothetical protein
MSVATAEVNGTARMTASPPKSTPTTATERSVTRGDSPTVCPILGELPPRARQGTRQLTAPLGPQLPIAQIPPGRPEVTSVGPSASGTFPHAVSADALIPGWRKGTSPAILGATIMTRNGVSSRSEPRTVDAVVCAGQFSARPEVIRRQP